MLFVFPSCRCGPKTRRSAWRDFSRPSTSPQTSCCSPPRRRTWTRCSRRKKSSCWSTTRPSKTPPTKPIRWQKHTNVSIIKKKLFYNFFLQFFYFIVSSYNKKNIFLFYNFVYFIVLIAITISSSPIRKK